MAIVWTLINIMLWLFNPLLSLLRNCWDLFVSAVFHIACSWRKRTHLPPVFNPTLLLSATQLAFNIRLRKMTSVDVVKAYITRLSEINPILNAIVQENFQMALIQAQKIDERLKQGYLTNTLTIEYLKEHEPLLGVPFTVKETIAVEGFRHTAGLVARQNQIATKDADVVTLLKKAGAIFLATTNVSELGMWWETDNRLYGRTNNPYDVCRTPGGSSGGECALMCACGTPISIGTDTGGSIRLPAFFSGVFGHKPTEDTTSIKGCNIHEDKEHSTLQVVGPISKHSSDLNLIMKIIAPKYREKLNLHKPIDVGTLKFYTMKDDGGLLTTKVHKSLQQIQEMVCQHFYHSYDIIVDKVYIPEMSRSYFIWQEKMNSEYGDLPPIYKQLADNQGEINIWTEFTRSLLGRGRHTLPSLMQSLFDLTSEEIKRRIGTKEVSKTPKHDARWIVLQMRIQRLLGDNGILFFPSHPTLAPYHRESYYRPFNFVYAAIFNALGFPVTQVPLGLDPVTGLPLGIQVIGGKYQDRLTLAVAKDLENRFGGWKCPSKIL